MELVGAGLLAVAIAASLLIVMTILYAIAVVAGRWKR